ncbi:MAG: hypothetical protein ACK53L_21725, partial [Pirellulaceae bacterium]
HALAAWFGRSYVLRGWLVQLFAKKFPWPEKSLGHEGSLPARLTGLGNLHHRSQGSSIFGFWSPLGEVGRAR